MFHKFQKGSYSVSLEIQFTKHLSMYKNVAKLVPKGGSALFIWLGGFMVCNKKPNKSCRSTLHNGDLVLYEIMLQISRDMTTWLEEIPFSCNAYCRWNCNLSLISKYPCPWGGKAEFLNLVLLFGKVISQVKEN